MIDVAIGAAWPSGIYASRTLHLSWGTSRVRAQQKHSSRWGQHGGTPKEGTSIQKAYVSVYNQPEVDRVWGKIGVD